MIQQLDLSDIFSLYLIVGAEKILIITNRFQDIGFTLIVFVVSRIRWTAVPKEASGIYQCRDSNDVRQSASNTTLIVSSKQFYFCRCLNFLFELTLYVFQLRSKMRMVTLSRTNSGSGK
jgi:hypothetical protein